MTITRNHLNSILMVSLCQEDVYNFFKKCVLGKNFYLILLVRNVTFLLSKEYVLSEGVGGGC